MQGVLLWYILKMRDRDILSVEGRNLLQSKVQEQFFTLKEKEDKQPYKVLGVESLDKAIRIAKNEEKKQLLVRNFSVFFLLF